uniref:Uncharacterized protein n=1 Tax=Panagrolaimus sp. PS1159 TaxID=55785 RepID=A0AC35GX47_9BILA
MHSRSQLDHIFWLLIDFSGILTFSLCIGLQRLAMRQESSSFFNNFYIYTLIFVVYLQYISTSALFVLRPFWKTRHIIRLFTCLLCGIWLYIPIIHRYFITSSTPDIGLPYHSSAFQWLLISGIFMGVNFPECICPGFFDYFCYGHQIFHICIFMVTWNLCDGATHDAKQYSNLSQTELCGPMIKVLVGNALGIATTLWVLMKYANLRINDKKAETVKNDCGGVPDEIGTAN